MTLEDPGREELSQAKDSSIHPIHLSQDPRSPRRYFNLAGQTKVRISPVTPPQLSKTRGKTHPQRDPNSQHAIQGIPQKWASSRAPGRQRPRYQWGTQHTCKSPEHQSALPESTQNPQSRDKPSHLDQEDQEVGTHAAPPTPSHEDNTCTHHGDLSTTPSPTQPRNRYTLGQHHALGRTHSPMA
ncbi:hypothetical protein Tco_0763383 [Tanacetum coccineum]